MAARQNAHRWMFFMVGIPAKQAFVIDESVIFVGGDDVLAKESAAWDSE